MALALTVTLDTSGAFATLRVSGGTGTYTVHGYPAGDYPDYTVRTTWVRPSGAGADVRVGIDGQIPLNTPTAYHVTDSAGAVLDAGPYTIAADAPILSDATDPTRYASVVVVSQPPNEWEAGSVSWDVLGQAAPYVSVLPMRLREGTIELLERTRAERAGLRALLAPGNPMLLRAVCPDAVDDMTFIVEHAREELVDEQRPPGHRILALDYRAVSADLGPVTTVPGRTYASLLTEAPTYDDVLFRYATYADVLTGTPSTTLGPELVTNGNFSAGGTGWGSFWSALAWSFAASTALSAGGPGVAVIGPVPVYNMATGPGRRYRIAGRVRCTDAAAIAAGSPLIHMITNADPGVADYFQPGSSVTAASVPASASWQPFAVTLTVPAGHDVVTVYYRAELVTAGAVVEFDDLSVREVT